jgi:hypothetical protein
LYTKAATPLPGTVLSIYRELPRLIHVTPSPMTCVDCSEVPRTYRLDLGGFGWVGKGGYCNPNKGTNPLSAEYSIYIDLDEPCIPRGGWYMYKYPTMGCVPGPGPIGQL